MEPLPPLDWYSENGLPPLVNSQVPCEFAIEVRSLAHENRGLVNQDPRSFVFHVLDWQPVTKVFIYIYILCNIFIISRICLRHEKFYKQ